MMNTSLLYSYSAPKKFTQVFDFRTDQKVSPGISPSAYAVQNFPVEHSSNCKNNNVFFCSEVPINWLQQLREFSIIEEDDESSLRLAKNWQVNKVLLEKWESKSCSRVRTDSETFHKNLQKEPFPLEKTPPPPGFPEQSAKFNWADIGSDSDFTPSSNGSQMPTIQVNEIKLQKPPRKGIEKREERSNFESEQVSDQMHTGKLKFYHLKKRFGFITLDKDSSDVFLCEDDLVLSGIHIKKFKESVLKKEEVSFSFYIKEYNENAKQKRKAISIQIINPSN